MFSKKLKGWHLENKCWECLKGNHVFSLPSLRQENTSYIIGSYFHCIRQNFQQDEHLFWKQFAFVHFFVKKAVIATLPIDSKPFRMEIFIFSTFSID